LTLPGPQTPPGNGHNSSLGNRLSYIVSDYLDFVEVPTLTTPISGPSQEDVAIPPVLDPTLLNIIYHSVIQHQTSSGVDLPVTIGTKSAHSTLSVPEQNESRPEPSIQSVSFSSTSSAPAIADLVVITSLDSPTLTFRPACSVMTTGLASPMITSVKTPSSMVFLLLH